jgi:ankyrin repeat protein
VNLPLEFTRDPDGYPALHVAVEYNFLNMVEFLSDEAGVEVNFVDRKGITALDLTLFWIMKKWKSYY